MEQSQHSAVDLSDPCATLDEKFAERSTIVATLHVQDVALPTDVTDAAELQPRDLTDEVEALEQQARELARFVESSRIQTLHQSDEKIEALGQRARDRSEEHTSELQSQR